MFDLQYTADGLPVVDGTVLLRTVVGIDDDLENGSAVRVMRRENSLILEYIRFLESRKKVHHAVFGGVLTYALLRAQYISNGAKEAMNPAEDKEKYGQHRRKRRGLPRVSQENLEALISLASQRKEEILGVVNLIERENAGLFNTLGVMAPDPIKGFMLGVGIVYEALRRQAASDRLKEELGIRTS